MTDIILPDQWPRLSRHLTSAAKSLFLDALSYERQNPQPGDQHLTVDAADLARANYGLDSADMAAAAKELLACGWWQARGARMFVGGPPEIADRLYTRERLDHMRAVSRATSRKHRKSRAAAEPETETYPSP